jgi:hypothetical protein
VFELIELVSASPWTYLFVTGIVTGRSDCSATSGLGIQGQRVEPGGRRGGAG